MAIAPVQWLKNRLRSWLATPTADASPSRQPARSIYGDEVPQNLTAKQAAFRSASEVANENLRLSLMGLSAGWWASDHAEEAQHFTGWNYCAIHSKAKQAMQATVKVCRRIPLKGGKGDGGKPTLSGLREKSSTNPDQPEYDLEPLPPTHPACRLLAKPNPRWSAGLWWYMLSQQCNLTGSALIWVVRDRGGRPAEMWVIPTALTRPQMPTQAMPEGAYWITATGLFTMTGGFPASYGVGALAGITIDARDVHPVRWPHPYLLADGMSPLAAGSVQIDLAEEIDQAAWAVLHNEVDPSLLVSLDPTMQVDIQELDRVEASINARRAGTNNKGKVMVMQGASIAQVHRTPSELDYSNSRAQTRDGVLAIHGVSPIFCGIAEAGSQAAYFTSLKQSIELSVQPELDLAAGELTRLVHKLYGDETLEVVITAKSFDDPDVLERKRQTNVSAKSVTINEDRALQGLPPVWWGDVQIGTAIPPDQIDDQFDHVASYSEVLAEGRQRRVMQETAEREMPSAETDIDDAAESGQPDAADANGTGMRKPELTGVRTGKKSAAMANMPVSIRERLNACMLNGFHKAGKWDEDKHPRADDGRFGSGGGSGGGDDSGSKPSGDSKPSKPSKPTAPKPNRSPTAAFAEDANALAYGLETGDTDPDEFEGAVGDLVSELEESLAARLDAYQDGEIDELRKVHSSEVIDHPEAEAAIDDFQSELASIKADMVAHGDAVHQTTAALADAIKDGDEDEIAEAMAAFESEMAEYEEMRAEVANRMVAATEAYSERLSEVTEQLAAPAEEAAGGIDAELNDDTQAEADEANAELEAAGNPFRVYWEPEAEDWSYAIPDDDDADESAKAASLAMWTKGLRRRAARFAGVRIKAAATEES